MCDSQVKFVPGEAVRKKFGAFVVLVWYFGLKRLVQFPPHRAHTGPETTFLFEFIILRERTAAQNGLLHSSDNRRFLSLHEPQTIGRHSAICRSVSSLCSY